MIGIYNSLIYQPLFNLLIWLYNVVPAHDIGIAIILLTVVIKLILYPFSLQSIRAQKSMQSLQPKLEEIKVKYKDNKEKLSMEMMSLYKKEKVNPFSSCLPILIQFPFLIAVFQILRNGLSNGSFDMLYPFVNNPGEIQTLFLGFWDLSQPQIILAVLAGLAQYWQASMLMTSKPLQGKDGKPITGAKDENMMAMMNKQMKYFMPIFTVFIAATLPGGLALYWLVMTGLTVLQQWLSFRKKGDGDDQGEAPKVIEGEVLN